MQVMSKLLHRAIGLGGEDRDEAAYSDYRAHFEQSPVSTLRDMLELQPVGDPIDISEVEDAGAWAQLVCIARLHLCHCFVHRRLVGCAVWPCGVVCALALCDRLARTLAGTSYNCLRWVRP